MDKVQAVKTISPEIIIMVTVDTMQLPCRHCRRCHATVPIRNIKSSACGRCKSLARDYFPTDFDPLTCDCDICVSSWEMLTEKQRKEQQATKRKSKPRTKKVSVETPKAI